jgi:hypothetical protein
MGSDRGVFSLSAEGFVEFCLSSNESHVSLFSKSYVSEDGADNERSDGFDRGINCNGQLGFCKFKFGSRNSFKIDFERSNKSCFGKKVRSVVHAVKFVIHFFFFVLFLLDALLDFDTELKSNLLKLWESVLLAH